MPVVDRRRFLSSLAIGTVSMMAAPTMVLAQAATTPGAGTPLRRAILDALRPVAITDLGAPIEFQVMILRVSGNRAFVQVMAQRPGGRAIDLSRTPMARRQDLSLIDGPRIEAFMHRRNGRWTVEQHATGATDLWYSDPAFCRNYSTVMPTGMCR
jgi:hypothetical protein